LIKYINKSRLSTAVSDGTTIASAINSALASEAAFQAADSYKTVTELNSVLGQSDAFASEVKENIGKASVTGKAKKDLAGATISTIYYVKVSTATNEVEVYYGGTDSLHMVSPNVGTQLAN